MSTLDTILAFLQGKGLTRAQAAGVAGNLQVESGFRPDAANPRENAIGLAQWQGGRRTGLQTYARSVGGKETDLGVQLNYMWQELQGPERAALQRLQAAPDAGTAAAVFDQYYERSSGEARSQRIKLANEINAGSAGAAAGSGFGAGLAAGLAPIFGAFGAGVAGDLAGDAFGTSVDVAADVAALNPLAVFEGWQDSALAIGIKVGAVTLAAGLVLAGAIHTVRDK